VSKRKLRDAALVRDAARCGAMRPSQGTRIGPTAKGAALRCVYLLPQKPTEPLWQHGRPQA
jgi:hypothetical protein